MTGRPEVSPPTGAGAEWKSVVAEASALIEAKDEAAEAAAERQRPKGEGLRLGLTAVALVAVLAWNAWVWTRPPADAVEVDERVNLAWLVADLAEAVEDFREAEGRLPTEAELGDELDADVTYSVSGAEYSVTATGDEGMVRYDGAQALEEWVALQASGSGRPAAAGDGSGAEGGA